MTEKEKEQRIKNIAGKKMYLSNLKKNSYKKGFYSMKVINKYINSMKQEIKGELRQQKAKIAMCGGKFYL